MNIFLARNNIQAGPYSLDQVNQMFATGQIEMSDLMWHEGMDNWKTVGEMTNNQPFYRPAFTIMQSNSPTEDNEEDYIINNRPSDVVKTPESEDASVWDKYANNNPYKSDKTDKSGKTTLIRIGKNTAGMDISGAKKQLDLASVSNRILAKIIDTLLFNLPTAIVFFNINPSSNVDKILEISTSNNYSPENLEKLNNLIASSIPPQILLISMLLFFGIMFFQMFLLLRRGQTVGKMAMGIRILDIQSNAIPDFWHGIFLRSVLTTLAYSVQVIGIVILVIDFFMMLNDPNRQSLHDKIAKTYVVRADDTQTTPLELKPDA